MVGNGGTHGIPHPRTTHVGMLMRCFFYQEYFSTLRAYTKTFMLSGRVFWFLVRFNTSLISITAAHSL